MLEVGEYLGRRAARVSCSGDHAPVEKWMQLSSLVAGKVVSCGCGRLEKASARMHALNTSEAPPRLGTGTKGLPPHGKYTPTGPEWKYDENGRECSYSGQGNCGHAFKRGAISAEGTSRGCIPGAGTVRPSITRAGPWRIAGITTWKCA